MRERKFRCWDGNNKMMWEVTDIQWAKKGGLIYIRGTFIKNGKKEPIGGFKNQMTTKRWNNLILLEFIGLKDKNGIEIYFGDILATSNNNPIYDFWEQSENGYTVVKERDDELGVTYSRWFMTTVDDSIYNIRFCEVIGNIWENPELLK